MAETPAPTSPDDLACIEVVEIVTDYLEGALDPAEAHPLEHHLAGCPGCTEYVEQMRALAGSLSGVSADALPADMRDGLVEAFRGLRDH